MQEFKARDDFGPIESGSLLRKATALLDMKHEITAIQVLHHKEQVALRVKYIKNIARKYIFNIQIENGREINNIARDRDSD